MENSLIKTVPDTGGCGAYERGRLDDGAAGTIL